MVKSFVPVKFGSAFALAFVLIVMASLTAINVSARDFSTIFVDNSSYGDTFTMSLLADDAWRDDAIGAGFGEHTYRKSNGALDLCGTDHGQ